MECNFYAVEKPDCEVDEYKLMVRQSYPYKTSGKQDTEKARSKPAMDEVSRVLLSDGRVIKIMKDGSTKVCPNCLAFYIFLNSEMQNRYVFLFFCASDK